MRRIPMLRASVGTAAIAAGLTAIPIPAAAATPVTHVRCSASALTTAISKANNEGGTLDLAPRCRYVLTEASSDTVGLPPIRNTIVIHGHDATIARSAGSINFRIFYVENSGNLQLQNLTITKGDSNGGGAPAFSSGGGIYSAGRLRLEHVTVIGNTAGRGGGGGVTIADNGTASIVQSKISGNTTTGVAGGLAAEGRSTTVTDSRITFNTADAGGGILNSGGSLTLKNADVRGNNAQEYGGGIVNLSVGSNTGSLRMYNSEVRFNNVLGVGLGVFSGGGGLFNFSGGAVRAEDSSVSNNTSEGSGTSAGGIRNFATLQLTRTKVMDNRSVAAPGGIDNGSTPASTVSLVNSDVRNNNDTNCEGSAGPVPGCQG